jgi:hypothetical protein
VPPGRTVTYGRIVCELRPNKKELHRTRLTVGGNLIDYPGDVSTKTAGLTTAKLLFNSVISTPEARFMGIDVKNFYLNTPMDRYEYMRLPIDLIPDEIIAQYTLLPLVHNGYVYMEIRQGMYGLPQAGMLANKLLQKRLATHGYRPTEHTHGLWKHDTRPVSFLLVVDDFGVKYVGQQHAEHLLTALNTYYPTSTDWEGTLYCGITLKWDYEHRTVDLSMPGYVQTALDKFKHAKPRLATNTPSKWNQPIYGKQSQLTNPADATAAMTNDQTKMLQRVVGTFLFYGCAVDPTLLHALNDLASAQTKGTQATADAMIHILNYLATHPDATIRYYASDMALHIHSDASYLTAPEARSRAGGHFFLSSLSPAAQPPPNNGPVHNVAKIIKNVMSSAAEAEVGGLYVNAREGIPLRTTLEELGHPQPPTPLQTDNTTAHGIITGTCKQQRTRAIDMRFYWLRDWVQQGQFHLHWAPGQSNLGDYFTKHHSPSHHRAMRPMFLLPASGIQPRHLRGCVELHPQAKVTRMFGTRTSVRQQVTRLPQHHRMPTRE